MNKFRIMSVFVVLAMLFSFANVSPAAAEEPSPPVDPSGWTQGSGTHFELPGSPYLPVTLDSSVSVTLTLSSVPKVVDLMISADPAIGSAEFTLSGFAADTLYYHYEDEGLDPVTFTTDANGSFTFTQDLSESHHVWFRETPSTYYLYDNATGGNCTSFGTWDWGTKTCTMTQDVYQAIFIRANGITLDGNGFSSLDSDEYYAVYSYNLSDVTIKNLNISGSTYGILALEGNNLTVTNNSVSGGNYGIFARSADTNNNVTITNNTISNPRSYGIYALFVNNSNVSIDQNTISGPGGSYGIDIENRSGAVAITNNVISGFYYGISADSPDNWTITNNTISNSSRYGLYLFNRYNGSVSVYNNNFINNPTQIFNYYYGTRSFFNQAAPVGGNFFSNFNTPGQGCNNANSDSFCDSPYYFNGGQDNLPWTTQDGWVVNQAPTADAGASYSGNEGSAIALSSASASDPDGDTLTYTWNVDSNLCSFNNESALNPTLTCSDNGSYTATLDVFDGTETVSSAASVTVNNIAPTLGAISVDVAMVPVNTAISASANFTDPGTLDTHSATWDWGDGTTSGTVTQGAGSGSVNDSHEYSLPGVYTIKLTVTDKDNAVSNESVYQFVVVYDPSGGFVTGGGWIDSPVNADYQYMQVGGKATFGFVAKYKKGANVPDGNTVFQFKAGDLSFYSSSYEWLVVAGNTAQFKGEGTINGEGSYKFMITADDDNPDTFRIKIWYEENGSEIVVYDNGSQQSLGGGSIVVHK